MNIDKDKKISKYLTLYDTYRNWRPIDNTPKSQEIIKNIEATAVIYDNITEHFGVKPFLHSFYRNQQLDSMVAGYNVTWSQHQTGQAMDIDYDSSKEAREKGIQNRDLALYILKNEVFDHFIWEMGNHINPGWIHLSYNLNGNRNLVTWYNGASYIDLDKEEFIKAVESKRTFENVKRINRFKLPLVDKGKMPKKKAK